MEGRALTEKLNLAQLLRLLAAFHTFPLCYLRAENLRAYARKNYATVEIHREEDLGYGERGN